MYTDHFGLSEQPFQLTPDARFWFASRTHKKAMAYLGYGLAQSEGFVVITGEIGAGKSTLAAHLLATVDPARLNAIAFVSTQVEGDDMLRLVAQRLGLGTAGTEKARLLDAVEGRLEEELRAGKRTLLVVDEAQNLSVSALEELRMLSNFQRAGRALVQILLLGQPEFRDKLAAPGLEQLRQRVIASHHLGPMAADEMEGYVRHRLGLVGWSGRPEFEPAAFAALHGASGGVPRRLNQLASRLLLQAAIEDCDRIGADAVAGVVEDLAADLAADLPAPHVPAPEPAAERVLPLRSVPRSDPEPAAPDPALAARIAALESRAEEQEATLRRVLTLLIEWVEKDGQAPVRSNAA